MKKLLLTAILLVAGTCAALTQTLQPSKVEKSEDLGEYQKANYVHQSATYNGIDYREAYLVNGFQFFFSPQATVIISPENKVIYSSYNNEDGWAAYPTFYFPRNKNHSFIISVETGMEEYWGSDIYVIDKDYKCTFAGHLGLASANGIYINDYYETIETALRLNDQGKRGIRFTFACDSLISIPGGDSRFSDVFSSKDIYFTFMSDTLVPCPSWNNLPGIQRMNLYNNIKEPVLSVHFFDINNDGEEDMVYALSQREYTITDESTQKSIRRNDGSTVVVYLCKDRKIKEELIFDFDEPIGVEYKYDNGLLAVGKYPFGYQSKPQAITYYRLEGKELVEVQ